MDADLKLVRKHVVSNESDVFHVYRWYFLEELEPDEVKEKIHDFVRENKDTVEIMS